MENIWIVVLFGVAMGAGFYIGKELFDTIIELVSVIVDKIINKEESEDKKWN